MGEGGSQTVNLENKEHDKTFQGKLFILQNSPTEHQNWALTSTIKKFHWLKIEN